MRKILALLLLALSFGASAAPTALPLEQCAVQATYGFPAIKKQGVTAICRKGYLTYFDTRAGVPLFVSYVLTPEHAAGCLGREHFETDPTAGNVPTPKDYAKSGYDIGHNANAADLAWDPQVSEEAALMTNMSPQMPGFNRGIWKKLEDGTRGWALSRQHPLQVYVVNAVDRKQDKMIGKNLVSVPHALGKVLIDTVTGEVQIFYFKNEASKANLNTFITSLAEIQKQTGVQFPMPPKPVFTKLWSVELKSARKAKASVCALPGQ
jgi:endonuclease G